MYLRVTTPRTSLPLAIDGVKDYVQEFSTDGTGEALLTLLMESATDAAEDYMNRITVPTSFEQAYDCWPTDGEISIQKNPVIINDTYAFTIEYYNADGDDTELSASDYYTIIKDGILRIYPKADISFPVTDGRKGAIRISYTAGYDPEYTVPAAIKSAMLYSIREAYDHRENHINITDSTWRALLQPYKIYTP